MSIILIVTATIYSNIYKAPFIFDEVYQIENKVKIKDLKNYFSPRVLLSPRPLVEFTFALNYKFGKLNVFGYHLVNVIIHIINGVVVYFLALTIFNRFSNNPQCPNSSMPQFGNSSISLMALLAALIFIAHPLQTQAVTYTVQRYTSMAAMFYFLSILFYIKARLVAEGSKLKAQSSEHHALSAFNFQPLVLYILCILCGFFAFLSKQNTASLPGAILLTEYLLFDRTWQGWKRKLLWFAPFFLLMGLFIFYVSGLFRGGVEFGSLLEDVSDILRAPGTEVSRWIYLCTQFNVVVIYIQLLFFPVGQNLDWLYPFKIGFFDGYTPLTFIFLIAAVVVGIWNIKKRPVISFGIFWFFITLSVESSVFPIIDPLFEHRLYLPIFGFGLVIAYIVFCLLPIKRLWCVILSILVIASLGTATHLRNRTYENGITLWSDVVSKSPLNFRAYYNLGNALYKNGRMEEAIKSYSDALRIKQDFAVAHLNLGIALTEVGRLDNAISHLLEAMRIKPGDAGIHNNLGNALMKLGRLQKAVLHFSEAIRIAPKFAQGHNNLGIALAQQGNLNDAMVHLSEALKIEPHNAKTHNNLGQAFILQGNLSKAAQHYSEAVRIQPGHAGAHYKLGVVLVRQGDVVGGIEHFSKALKINPGFGEARQRLNWALRLKNSKNPLYER